MADLREMDESVLISADEVPGRAKALAYNLLLRQSRALGRIATTAFLRAKSLFVPTKTESTSEVRSEVDELKEIVRRSHEILADVQTVFPFTLFPSRVCLDRSVITITKRSFFWSSNTISIRIEDILNVSTSLGPFFGTLDISSRVMNSVDHYSVSFLWRRDAQELKHIILGYIIAKNSGINVDHLERNELVETLRQLGEDSSVTAN